MSGFADFLFVKIFIEGYDYHQGDGENTPFLYRDPSLNRSGFEYGGRINLFTKDGYLMATQVSGTLVVTHFKEKICA